MPDSENLSSIVIPAHNEAENLQILIPKLFEALKNHGGNFEVIVINNDSSDNTEDVVARFSKDFPELRTLREPTLGYGRAVLAGLRDARGAVIGIIRADNQEKPEDLVRMFDALKRENADLYKAIRLHRINDGLKRVVVSRVYNALFKILFGLRSKDLNASPKVFTRGFYDAAHLESKDWFIDAEMVIKAEKMGFKVGEIRIEYLPRLKGSSTVRFRHIFEFLRNMLSWRKRIRHGELLEK